MTEAMNRAGQILKAYASVAWRVMGSPRVPGLERALTSLGGAQITVELPQPRAVRYAGIGIACLGVLSLLTWAGVAMAKGGGREEPADLAVTPTTAAALMTEIQALDVALGVARENGLSGNFAHIARRITLFEYAQAVGEAYRAQQGMLDAPSETEVWAIAFAGDVEATLSTGDTVGFDNITVVVDAVTGRVYRVEAFYGDYESPARAPVWLKPPPTGVPK